MSFRNMDTFSTMLQRTLPTFKTLQTKSDRMDDQLLSNWEKDFISHVLLPHRLAHVQVAIKQTVNKQVNSWFKDLQCHENPLSGTYDAHSIGLIVHTV